MKLAASSPCPGGRPRCGFTLPELLVVIAIIAVLATLSAGAVFKFIGTQHRHNTEATCNKVSEAVNQQWQAVLDSVKTESIPIGVMTLAGGNSDRARVIWIKLRLKQEFPMNFAEALNPSGPPNPYVLPGDLPGIYKVQSGAVPVSSESAVCLYLSLKRARRGMVFDPDASFSSNELKDAGSGFKQVVDDWGTPLVLFRWPTGPQGPNPSGAKAPGSGDPDARLADSAWVSSPQGIWFNANVHSVAPNATYKLFPVIASAGPDQTLGLDQWMNGAGNAIGDNVYSKNLLAARGG